MNLLKSARSVLFCSCLLLPVLAWVGCQSTDCWLSQRKVIGETAYIRIAEIDHALEARIDTGARTTSIHALNIQIENDAGDFDANVGKTVRFDIVDAEGTQFPQQATIEGVTVVRNAQGVEQRYYVPMTLSWSGVEKVIQVNLRDRSAMTYKLLIGRDWLADDFLVNVDLADTAVDFSD
ncbi:ATP-dependent zinc protease family protein [Coraliomargarita akajimensis]|uniref:Retropepsin-like aspartic endopeptidase domain-containing protein n=1 Tax=Coraliomargarita akajimensis (strain DSM 45221 / IAM 15411 / JCM 23193 / KCTC 12865 / 04OKA010-24) TaxID=583355 RepID=D5EQ93_CORAD|nr:RimK/LysX family protein [Coraliomargarita akajimensis]ADE53861.1 protein of unknown function DUF785 [Coraliomargarita akajimensis DSM 45221]